MIHVNRKRTALVLATAALVATAAPALASEGAPGTGTPLPSTLTPVVIPQLTPPGSAPAPGGAPAPGTTPSGRVRPARPRITRAQLVPRRVKQGRRSRLRVSLQASARVRVVIERTRHGKRVTVKTMTVAAKGNTLSLRLPANLKAARYRIRIVALDAGGNRSSELTRSLTVVRRGR